jgi:transposase-like protein
VKRNLTDFPQKPKEKKKVTKFYPDSVKLEAVKLWLLTGNLIHTAAALNISHNTVRDWRYTKWWADLVEELKAEEHIVLSQKLKKIAERSLEQMEDRLKDGDWVLNKMTGELQRKPVSLRDTTQAFNSVHDRVARLEKSPREEQNNKQVVDRLQALAAKFEEIAGKRQPIQVTDVIYAIHDERKEGLQERAGLGKEEEAEPGEGSSSEEFSTVHDGTEGGRPEAR